MSAVVLLRVTSDPDLSHGVQRTELSLDEPSLDALALAVSFRRHADAPVHGLASGPEGWDIALREAIALGADRVERTWNPALADAGIVANSRALCERLPGDARVIVAGSMATDHGSGLLPWVVADHLSLPLIAEVTEITVESGCLAARVRGAGGRRTTYALPERVVLVAARGGRLPYPTVARRVAARKAPIPGSIATSSPGDLEPNLRLDGFGPARPVTRHLLRPSASANAGGRLRQLMAGGASNSAPAQKLQANTGTAGQLADLLAKEGFLS